MKEPIEPWERLSGNLDADKKSFLLPSATCHAMHRNQSLKKLSRGLQFIYWMQSSSMFLLFIDICHLSNSPNDTNEKICERFPPLVARSRLSDKSNHLSELNTLIYFDNNGELSPRTICKIQEYFLLPFAFTRLAFMGTLKIGKILLAFHR